MKHLTTSSSFYKETNVFTCPSAKKQTKTSVFSNSNKSSTPLRSNENTRAGSMVKSSAKPSLLYPKFSIDRLFLSLNDRSQKTTDSLNFNSNNNINNKYLGDENALINSNSTASPYTNNMNQNPYPYGSTSDINNLYLNHQDKSDISLGIGLNDNFLRFSDDQGFTLSQFNSKDSKDQEPFCYIPKKKELSSKRQSLAMAEPEVNKQDQPEMNKPNKISSILSYTQRLFKSSRSEEERLIKEKQEKEAKKFSKEMYLKMKRVLSFYEKYYFREELSPIRKFATNNQAAESDVLLLFALNRYNENFEPEHEQTTEKEQLYHFAESYKSAQNQYRSSLQRDFGRNIVSQSQAYTQCKSPLKVNESKQNKEATLRSLKLGRTVSENYIQNVLNHTNQCQYTSAFRNSIGQLKKPNEIRTNTSLLPVPYPTFLRWSNISKLEKDKITKLGKSIVHDRRQKYGLQPKRSTYLTTDDLVYILQQVTKIQRAYRRFDYKKLACVFLQSRIRSFLTKQRVRNIFLFREEMERLGERLMLLYKGKHFFCLLTEKKYKNRAKLSNVLGKMFSFVKSAFNRLTLLRLKMLQMKKIKLLKYIAYKDLLSKEHYLNLLITKATRRTTVISHLDSIFTLFTSKVKKGGFSLLKRNLRDGCLHNLVKSYEKNNVSYLLRKYFYRMKNYKNVYIFEKYRKHLLKSLMSKKGSSFLRHYLHLFKSNVNKILLSKAEFEERVVALRSNLDQFSELIRNQLIRKEGVSFFDSFKKEFLAKSKALFEIRSKLQMLESNKRKYYAEGFLMGLENVKAYKVLNRLQNAFSCNSLDRLKKEAFKQIKINHSKITTEKETKSICQSQSSCRIHLKPSIVTFSLSSTEKVLKQVSVESQQKYNFFVEAKRLNTSLQGLLNKTLSNAVKSIREKAKTESVEKATNIITRLRLQCLSSVVNKIKEQGDLRSKSISSIRKLYKGVFLQSLYSSARVFNRIYNNLNFAQTLYKHIKLSKLNKLRRLIRSWRLFNHIQSQTFDKYQALSKEMWSLFSKGNQGNKGNNGAVLVKSITQSKAKDITTTDKFTSLFNLSQQTNKDKKDYLSLKILSDFERQILESSEAKEDKEPAFDSISTNFFK